MGAEANRETIERFYAAFGECNGAAMTACYGADPHFRDPAFGNNIRASLRFDGEGRIVDHVDEFDFGRWARQALGPKGALVALLPPLRKKARAQARDQLATFKRDETGSSV